MQHASASPSAPRCVWLPLLAILAGLLALPSVAGAGTLDDWGAAPGKRPLSATPPPAPEPPLEKARVAQQAAEQPGRPGVTAQPGRPGVAEQPSRSGVKPGKAKRDPMAPGGHIIVEAVLNRTLLVPLLLDTGATYTVLTKQTIKDLRITDLERLPKQPFQTGGGVVLLPITTLKSIRVGTAAVHEVEVAIDIYGHLPMGLLGMSFLRHFNVTVDQAQGQVQFERR